MFIKDKGYLKFPQESKRNSRRSYMEEFNSRYGFDYADCNSTSKANEGDLGAIRIIPMPVWKSLHAEIKKYREEELPENLQKSLKIFRTILKDKDIYALVSSDLDKLEGEFPSIEILKSIDQMQFVIGSDKLREKFNNSIFKLIYCGAWGKAIEYIFGYHHMIAKYINVDVAERTQMTYRQINSVKKLRKGGILTDAEAKKLYDVLIKL